jgi:protein tyrosine phosphatase
LIKNIDKHNTLFLEKELEIKAGQEDLAADDIMNNYVNASYVSGPLPEDDNLFIATQGPLQCTVEAFWKMIVVKNIKLIIMLTNVLEENRNKCEIYWPVNDSTSITFGKYKITLETEVFILDKAIIQRNIVIESEPDNLRYTVTQLHVVCWADHSAPEEELGFKMIEMILSLVDDCRNSNKDSPIVVHCR